MIAAVDVHYHSAGGATAAVIVFRDWREDRAEAEFLENIAQVEPYVPGNFYKRELPCLLPVLQKVQHTLEAVIVDGYVWLAPDNRPGLGAHLYRALGSGIAVIGVAKDPYRESSNALPVIRGRSRKPLYVSAVGIDPALAAKHVASMQGRYRIPTMLKRVDRLCRSLRDFPGI
ncbi:endonuclease V [Desulfomonile tiedjei]|uniref:Deoxyinosine 3'endonuclease (Endonuclease V) n=1 Tax=Desulfomonile tiedjei (strain ATCC 49306 / DSM 6799 / DCB-1) TaxID=706587 RepID=I4C518_DESTA|nr:endonuclease V [Desulfomonile tiedjei]AFM24659.1 deoxyinosine 3'endonuclease (endonuclease V) [Desulfomonile tiedjei DSM 6799]